MQQSVMSPNQKRAFLPRFPKTPTYWRENEGMLGYLAEHWKGLRVAPGAGAGVTPSTGQPLLQAWTLRDAGDPGQEWPHRTGPRGKGRVRICGGGSLAAGTRRDGRCDEWTVETGWRAAVVRPCGRPGLAEESAEAAATLKWGSEQESRGRAREAGTAALHSLPSSGRPVPRRAR